MVITVASLKTTAKTKPSVAASCFYSEQPKYVSTSWIQRQTTEHYIIFISGVLASLPAILQGHEGKYTPSFLSSTLSDKLQCCPSRRERCWINSILFSWQPPHNLHTYLPISVCHHVLASCKLGPSMWPLYNGLRLVQLTYLTH